MRRIWLLRRISFLVTIVTLGACHKAPEATAPALPAIAGTYNVNFIPTDSNSFFPIPDTIAYLGGQITIGPVATDGSFTGSYYLAFITGELSGTENGKGNITFTSFGASSKPPLEGEQYLQQVLPTCHWGQAASGAMTGSVAQDSIALLTVRGHVTVQCASPAGTGLPITNVVSMFAASQTFQP
jgi:hypothetical protein